MARDTTNLPRLVGLVACFVALATVCIFMHDRVSLPSAVELEASKHSAGTQSVATAAAKPKRKSSYEQWLKEMSKENFLAGDDKSSKHEKFHVIKLNDVPSKKKQLATARMQHLSSKARLQQLSTMTTTTHISPPAVYPTVVGKRIRGFLDVAAPLDPSDGAAVPAIVIPDKDMVTQPGQQNTQQQPPVQALAQESTQSLAEEQPTALDEAASPCAAAGIAAAAGCGSYVTIQTHVNPDGTVQSGPAITAIQPAAQYLQAQAARPYGAAPLPQVEYEDAEPDEQYAAAASAPAVQYVQEDPAPAAAASYVVAAGAAAPTVTGVGYSAPTFSDQTPNFFQDPFNEWHDEDAAQHAYALAQWRVKILQAKLKQANLRMKLLTVHPPPEDDSDEPAAAPAAAGGRRSHRGRHGRRHGGLARRTARQIKQVKEEMLALARETIRALRKLRGGGGGGGCCPSCGCAQAHPAVLPPVPAAPVPVDYGPLYRRWYGLAAKGGAAADAQGGEASPAIARLNTKLNDILRVIGAGKLAHGGGGGGGGVAGSEGAAAGVGGDGAAGAGATAAVAEEVPMALAPQVKRWKQAQALTSPAAAAALAAPAAAAAV